MPCDLQYCNEITYIRHWQLTTGIHQSKMGPIIIISSLLNNTHCPVRRQQSWKARAEHRAAALQAMGCLAAAACWSLAGCPVPAGRIWPAAMVCCGAWPVAMGWHHEICIVVLFCSILFWRIVIPCNFYVLRVMHWALNWIVKTSISNSLYQTHSLNHYWKSNFN
jgi:hypothetical protein